MMRHPFDGVIEPAKESRRAVLRRALAAVAGVVGLGVAGCGTTSPYTTPSMDGSGGSPPKASTMALGEEGGYATTFAVGEEGGSK
jgi:hypothetical protein